MDDITAQAAADQQIAEATAAELESLSLECRADPARLQRLLAPDFHEFGASGTEIEYEGTAARVAAATDLGGPPIQVQNMRGWVLADGLVMLKYTSQNDGRRSNRTSLWRRQAGGQWQIFHHQGTASCTSTIVELDSRRRVSLGRIGQAEHTRYLAHEKPDGSIILEPAVVLSETEASFLRNRDLVAAIEDTRAHPERTSVSFAELDE